MYYLSSELCSYSSPLFSHMQKAGFLMTRLILAYGLFKYMILSAFPNCVVWCVKATSREPLQLGSLNQAKMFTLLSLYKNMPIFASTIPFSKRNRAADQGLCLRYSLCFLNPKFEASSSGALQPSLCLTRSETTKIVSNYTILRI